MVFAEHTYAEYFLPSVIMLRVVKLSAVLQVVDTHSNDIQFYDTKSNDT